MTMSHDTPVLTTVTPQVLLGNLLRYARLTARNNTTCKPGLLSPFLSTRLVHYHAATLHILSPPLTVA